MRIHAPKTAASPHFTSQGLAFPSLPFSAFQPFSGYPSNFPTPDNHSQQWPNKSVLCLGPGAAFIRRLQSLGRKCQRRLFVVSPSDRASISPSSFAYTQPRHCEKYPHNVNLWEEYLNKIYVKSYDSYWIHKPHSPLRLKYKRKEFKDAYKNYPIIRYRTF